MPYLSSKSFLILILSCLVLSLIHFLPGFVGEARAATYYVATTGSDGNPGTIGQPFATMLKGVSVLGPGDTLYMREGTYDEQSNQIQMPSGTASQPITWVAYSGERVVIEGCPMYFYSQTGGAGTAHIIVDGFVFDKTRVDCMYVASAGNGLAAAPRNITVQNFDSFGSRGDGFTVAGYNITFRNGVVRDVSGLDCLLKRGNASYCHGFYIDGGDSILVENVEVYNTSGHAIKLSQDGPLTNAVVRNNVLHDWAQADYAAAILFGSNSSNSLAYNNRIYNCTGRDVTGNGIQAIAFWQGSGHAAYNNTIDVSGGNCTGGDNAGIIVFYGQGHEIRNNIVIGSDIHDYGGLGAAYAASNNFCDRPGLGCDIIGNPLLTADFHLQAGSPAINAGMALSGVPYDFECDARPQGAGYDIGADEYVP
jgi:hypothetical protein